LADLCEKAGIELTARAEDIAPEQYLRLAELSLD
jgi:16S rRNA A1518/A1519 N6-dimethyltransferase RsmA/KsgA/DIM1 with predicted DNA glycosylase/AP lyase activity